MRPFRRQVSVQDVERLATSALIHRYKNITRILTINGSEVLPRVAHDHLFYTELLHRDLPFTTFRHDLVFSSVWVFCHARTGSAKQIML